MSRGAASFSLSPSSSANVGIFGLSLDSSSSSSSSASGDPAPLFADSCLPVHGERRDDWCLYTMTEIEKSSIPSPKNTIAILFCSMVYYNFNVEYYHVAELLRPQHPCRSPKSVSPGNWSEKYHAPIRRSSELLLYLHYSRYHDHPGHSSLYAEFYPRIYPFQPFAHPHSPPTSSASIHHPTAFPPHFRSQDLR